MALHGRSLAPSLPFLSYATEDGGVSVPAARIRVQRVRECMHCMSERCACVCVCASPIYGIPCKTNTAAITPARPGSQGRSRQRQEEKEALLQDPCLLLDLGHTPGTREGGTGDTHSSHVNHPCRSRGDCLQGGCSVQHSSAGQKSEDASGGSGEGHILLWHQRGGHHLVGRRGHGPPPLLSLSTARFFPSGTPLALPRGRRRRVRPSASVRRLMRKAAILN